jgi:ABC-type nitrate/sulfonate/bicarbonate transport system substrate-binding protein
MGYSNIAGDETAAWYAVEQGSFTRHNINVTAQLISGGATTTAALLSGQIQVAHAGGSETLSAVANGADLEVVATLAGYYPYLFEVIPEIKTIQDLNGKKIGVSNIGGSADIATRVFLRQQGLDPDKDVTIVATGSAQNRTAALLSGAIQAGMAAPPDSLAVEAIGLHPLFDLAALHLPSANTTVVMQRSFVQANHDLVQRYVDALVEAAVAVKKDRDGTIAVLKKYYQSDDDHAMSVAYDFYANEIVNPMPFPKPEQFKDAVATLSTSNPAVANVDLNKLLDPEFVQNAVDRGLSQ